MIDLDQFLNGLNERSQRAFEGQQRILSFRQYLDRFCEQPLLLGRNAAQYLLDCFTYFGTEMVDGIGGQAKRFKLFDGKFNKQKEKLVGHEEVQLAILERIKRFAATGKSDRLVLLHGPNGSGKSSVHDLIVQALEHYSQQDEGVLFTFNWIFSERLESGGHLGFGGPREQLRDTLAFLEESMISCKISSDLREHPLFLLPMEERARLLDRLLAENADDARHRERMKGIYLREGQLSARSKAIFDALIRAYRGDLAKVLSHVQVERYFISERYRVGVGIVEPQQAVDAGAQQMTFDQGLALPTALQGISMRQLVGELIEGSGGIVAYSDMLKRPIELNKYLLNTTEEGTVSVAGTVAQLNTVFLGTCNEKYLSAFKANPDFTSFKGRIELIRVGYLREWKKEREIYREFIEEVRGNRHIAPHTLDFAALWAVMTRLRKPDTDNYEGAAISIVRGLTPLEKARLYGEGLVPDRLLSEEKKILLGIVNDLKTEHNDEVAEFEGFVCAAYEGRRGASAREMKALLAEAANDQRFKSLSPLAVFAAIERLVKDTSVYDFLRLEPEDGYHDPAGFVVELREEYFRWILVEIYDCMELIEEGEFVRRVEEYFRHVRAYASGEKLQNDRGEYKPASEEVMGGLEKLMNIKESADVFRKNLIGKIAAYSLDHRGEKLDYREIFPELFRNLRDSYYKQKQPELERIGEHVLLLGTDDVAMIPAQPKARAERALRNMQERHGYNEDSANEAIGFVLRKLRR